LRVLARTLRCVRGVVSCVRLRMTAGPKKPPHLGCPVMRLPVGCPGPPRDVDLQVLSSVRLRRTAHTVRRATDASRRGCVLLRPHAQVSGLEPCLLVVMAVGLDLRIYHRIPTADLYEQAHGRRLEDRVAEVLESPCGKSHCQASRRCRFR
jgi:hypothetical protein